MNNKIIVGLTGRFGAGCTTTYNLLIQEFDFKGFSLSNHLRKIAQEDKKYIKLPEKYKRSYLQNLGDKLRKNNNQAYLARISIDDIKKINNNFDIVVDSFKNPSEINEFRKEFTNFYLFAIDTETEIRWQRSKDKYDKDMKIFDTDDERDKGTDDEPFEGQQVKTCMRISDILINSEKPFFNLDGNSNPKAIEEYGQKIKGYIDLIKKPGIVTPSLDELYMHEASSISLRSMCLKRQVGAIIVRNGDEAEKGSYIIASGCNNVPYGETSCVELKGCFRDKQKNEIIEKIKYCSNCGTKINSVSIICQKCGEEIYIPKLFDICRAVHAEEEAILQAAKLGISVAGTTLFTTTHPCLLCSKKIINSGIKNIVYLESYPMIQSIDMLTNCKINRKKFEGVTSRVFNKLFLKEIPNL